jgi:hypothetical protein
VAHRDVLVVALWPTGADLVALWPAGTKQVRPGGTQGRNGGRQPASELINGIVLNGTKASKGSKRDKLQCGAHAITPLKVIGCLVKVSAIGRAAARGMFGMPFKFGADRRTCVSACAPGYSAM